MAEASDILLLLAERNRQVLMKLLEFFNAVIARNYQGDVEKTKIVRLLAATFASYIFSPVDRSDWTHLPIDDITQQIFSKMVLHYSSISGQLYSKLLLKSNPQ